MTAVPQLELAPGFHISRILKGGWQLSQGHRQHLDTDPVADMFRFAEAGITAFDCADIYTGVEELIGNFLTQWKTIHGTHQPIRVLTKFVPDYDDLATMDRGDVRRIIDRSLRRLGMDRLDMVQFSWWNYNVARYVEVAGWLQELQQEGKIELISGTNFNTAATREILDAGIPLATMQLQYSLLDRRPERGLTGLCDRSGMKLLCYGTVAGGFLSERWLGKSDPEQPYANRSLVKYRLVIEDCGSWDWFQSLLATLDTIAKKHQVTIANVATRAILDQPAVGGLIIGAATAAHLQDNLRVFHFSLDDEDRRQIQAIKEQSPGMAGEPFDAERDKEGPHGRIMRYNLNKGTN